MSQKTEASQAVDECAALRAAIESNMNLALKLTEMRAWKKHLATFDALFARAALKAQSAPTKAAQEVHAPAARMAECRAFLTQLSGNSGELTQGEDSARLDAVVEANRALLHQRSQLGIKKYGDTLEAKRYPHKELLMHALLEALDLSNYLQAAIMGIDRASAETGGVKS